VPAPDNLPCHGLIIPASVRQAGPGR